MDALLEGLTLAGWAIPWIAGGVLLTDGAFRVRRGEVALVGFSLGLVLEIWFANLLAQLVDIPAAFWLASGLVLVCGLAAGYFSKNLKIPDFKPWTWLLLAALTLLFTAIGRGLGVFDDYQNLPTVSLMAAGDVPPHFALDPSLRFGYHYFLLLLAAQLMRLGDLLPWTSLDMARGLSLALPLVLAAHWTHRMTRSWLAGCLGAAVLGLAGGARWLLLLLPTSWMAEISSQVTLIGSAASSAPSLSDAMISPWKIDGAGPIPFPFAFYSGINPPYIMLYTGIAGSGMLIVLLLLLTATRWRNSAAIAVTTALMAALAIANEITFLLLGIGIVLVGMLRAMSDPKKRTQRGLAVWLAAGTAALAIAALQGGLISEAFRSILSQGQGASSYFDPSPALVWPPAVVSAHLGALSLIKPWQLMLVLLEIGPIVLVTPALARRAAGSMRHGRWLEAGVLASSIGLLGALFLSFKGPLYTAAPRLMSGWLFGCALYFVPFTWMFARTRGDPARMVALAVGAVGCLGGVVLLATQLTAIQRPVYSTFITQLDASMTEHHWNKPEAGVLVFDPLVFRGPTVLGRPTRSSLSWYARSEDWERLRDAASPMQLRGAGFSYMYFDGQFWDGLDVGQQQALEADCVRQVERLDGFRSDTDYTKDFRMLLDIRNCR